MAKRLYSEIGNRLAYHREKKGLTQRQVSVTMKLLPQQISYIERGSKVPVKHLKTMAKLVGMKMGALKDLYLDVELNVLLDKFDEA